MKRGNKFHAKGIHTPDGYFHSQGEYRRWQELKLLERGKQILALARGPRLPLIVGEQTVGHYKCDFFYVENGKPIYEDFKGGPTMTEAAKLRIKLFEACYGFKVRITGKAKR
jgi:hypothetical protein